MITTLRQAYDGPIGDVDIITETGGHIKSITYNGDSAIVAIQYDPLTSADIYKQCDWDMSVKLQERRI